MGPLIFYLDTTAVVDFLIKDNTTRMVDFIKAVRKRRRGDVDVCTSDLAVFEAIPILIQEMGYRCMRNRMRSFRRMRRKLVQEEAISVETRRMIIPQIHRLRKSIRIIGFGDLSSEVYENAQRMAFNTRVKSLDALHISIAQYVVERSTEETNRQKTPQCYIVTNDTSDFNPQRFEEVRKFVKNIEPVNPQQALEALRRMK